MTIKNCPYCGRKPEIQMIGDNKNLFVCFCSKCKKTPVHNDEACSTPTQAIKIWNKRCGEIKSVIINEIKHQSQLLKDCIGKDKDTVKYIKTSDCEKYFYEHLDDLHMAAAMNAIDEMPNTDVISVKHGCWINENFYTRCSVCNNMATYDRYGQEVESDYCPHCGARMYENEVE